MEDSEKAMLSLKGEGETRVYRLPSNALSERGEKQKFIDCQANKNFC
jgi:hypothetical protein